MFFGCALGPGRGILVIFWLLGLKYGPLIWALSLLILVYVGLKVWALIGIWYIMAI